MSGTSHLSFEIEQTPQSAGTKARAGQLAFSGSDHSIATPALVPNTQRGFVPHLTNDHILSLPTEALYLSLEQFFDQKQVSYENCPYDLRRYLGLPSLNKGGPLLFLGVKDPSRAEEVSAPSSADHVLISTVRGSGKITLQQFLDINTAHPPDILLALSDEPNVPAPSKKRLHKSVTRTLAWADHITNIAKCDVFVDLVGSDSMAARRTFANYLLEKDESNVAIDERIAGYRLHISPFQAIESDTLSQLLNASLELLPPTKPRLASCPSGPHQILRLVKDVGLDLFVEDWSYTLATLGIALDFDYPKSKTQSRLLGINLFRSEFALAFDPLSSSILSTESNEKQPTTRAYLHHLLKSHEMTAHVLLSLHNTRMMKAFMVKIRQSILNGTLEHDARAFHESYEETCSAAEEAKAMLAAVEFERGKGRMKREREKELAAQLAEQEGDMAVPLTDRLEAEPVA